MALLLVRELLLELLPFANEGDLTQIQMRLVSSIYMYRMSCLLELDKFAASNVWVRVFYLQRSQAAPSWQCPCKLGR